MYSAKSTLCGRALYKSVIYYYYYYLLLNLNIYGHYIYIGTDVIKTILDTFYSSPHSTPSICGIFILFHFRQINTATMEPETTEAYIKMRKVCYELGQYRDALDSYQPTLRLKPDYHLAHNGMGNVYYDQGQYWDALNCYQHALRREPPGDHRAYLDIDIIRPNDHVTDFDTGIIYPHQGGSKLLVFKLLVVCNKEG